MLWGTAVCFGPYKPSFPSCPTAQKCVLKYSTGCANAYLKMQVGARLGNLSLHWSPFCLISCQWGGKGIQRQKVSVIVMALLWERNSDEFSKKSRVVFFILDNKDAIESAAEKPSCPAFLSWHTVWPAQVRAEEHKLHSQLHIWSHRRRGRVAWMSLRPGPISPWQENYNSLDPAENPNMLVRPLKSINQLNSLDFNGSVKLMDACCRLGPNRWILSSVQALKKKGEFTCCFSFIFGVCSTVFAQLLQKENRAPMSWCLNQKL